MEWKQGKRAASIDAIASPHMPAAKKVRLETAQTSVESGSYNERTSTSSPSVQSTHDVPLTATSFTAHSTSRRPKKYLCEYDDCDKAFDRPVRLEAHIRTHTNDRPFVCNETSCTKSFFKSEHLKAHIQNKHSNEATHVCQYVVSTNEDGEEFECGKAFTTATRLRRHTAIHEKAEELTCREPGCGQVFRKMETLQRHIKQEHLHEKAYRCAKMVADMPSPNEREECGQTFSTAGQLKAHEYREHAGMKYFCSTCSPLEHGMMQQQIGFPTYADYQIHMKMVHPPTCTICKKACDSNRALTAHMEIEHSSLASRQERYQCDYPGCGRGFTRKGNLNVHIQSVHVKTRNFVCGTTNLSSDEKCPGWIDANGCGAAFTTKASLENHVRTQHLQLPNLYHPRKSTRVNIKDNASIDTTAPLETFDKPHDVTSDISGVGYDALGLLTGSSYADSRPIACCVHGCPVRFSRHYDLVQHVDLAHGWNIDDVLEQFGDGETVEVQSWTGRTDAAFQDEGLLEDDEWSSELSRALQSSDQMPQKHFLDCGNDEFLQEQLQVRSHYDMVLDPMLAGT